MIPSGEIRDSARVFGVPISSIERDYAQGWVLSGLAGLDMSFKGGTALKKIYFGDKYRFSDDLDFTLMKVYGLEELEKEIKSIVTDLKKDTGIDFENGTESEKSDTGYVIYIKFRITNKTGSPIKIKLDISLPENEILLARHEKKEIINSYSDGIKGRITAYTPEEITAEKIRSCFQRTRPRDIYDLKFLRERADMNAVNEMLEKKFVFKGIEPDIKGLISRKEDFRNSWENSLKHQMKTVPEFDGVFDIIQTMMNELTYIKNYKLNK